MDPATITPHRAHQGDPETPTNGATPCPRPQGPAHLTAPAPRAGPAAPAGPPCSAHGALVPCQALAPSPPGLAERMSGCRPEQEMDGARCRGGRVPAPDTRSDRPPSSSTPAPGTGETGRRRWPRRPRGCQPITPRLGTLARALPMSGSPREGGVGTHRCPSTGVAAPRHWPLARGMLSPCAGRRFPVGPRRGWHQGWAALMCCGCCGGQEGVPGGAGGVLPSWAQH